MRGYHLDVAEKLLIVGGAMTFIVITFSIMTLSIMDLISLLNISGTRHKH